MRRVKYGGMRITLRRSLINKIKAELYGEGRTISDFVKEKVLERLGLSPDDPEGMTPTQELKYRQRLKNEQSAAATTENLNGEE